MPFDLEDVGELLDGVSDACGDADALDGLAGAAPDIGSGDAEVPESEDPPATGASFEGGGNSNSGRRWFESLRGAAELFMEWLSPGGRKEQDKD